MKKLKLPKRSGPKSPTTRPSEPKPKRITSGWGLFRTSLRAFVIDWRLYIKVLAIVAIPVDLITLIPSLASNASLSDYTSMAAIIMNVALLWVVIRRREGGLKSTLAEAYYDGNVALIRYVLVSVLLVLMLIPLALGLALYGASLYVQNADPFSAVELVIALVSLLLASPTLFMLVRFGFAPVVVVRDGLRPFASLHRSWRLTRKRFWPVAGRLILLIVFLALASLPATVITVLLSALKAKVAATAVFEIVETLVALPIFNLYLLELYRELERTAPSAPSETATENDFGDEVTDKKPEAEAAPEPAIEGESGEREAEQPEVGSKKPDAPAGAPA